ncbi:MAG: hypothetical protein Ct9H300mP16_14530 [Pseudomonadota bacterium]|nr:MAG: hypothetical protein Ct9H300mP16_14530 [Pseudomonadota bacterium]
MEQGIAEPSAACKDPEAAYMQVFRGLWADEELHRLRTHPSVLAFFERIFGDRLSFTRCLSSGIFFPQK